ncbi:MAG: TetR/AcrR family transcriptional regulator [Clostridiales bacterium]|nr:TetR/AcrR family transcriptional regulator [Clostridiales bacterium]
MKKQPEITDRTRKNFVEAFWSLAKEKPISKIAASEVARRAGYNRSTFYEYFLDTDDLLCYAEDQLLQEVKNTIIETQRQNNSPGAVFQAIFIAMNEKIYLLLGPGGDSGFLLKVRNELLPFIEENLPVDKNAPQFDYLVSFVNSAAFGLLQHWNEKGKDLSAAEIGSMIQNLVRHGLLGFVAGEKALPKLSDPGVEAPQIKEL